MIKTIISPFQRFVKTESLAGILLFGATILALIWANSDYAWYYQRLWNFPIGFSIGDFEIKKALILWINDGLMAIFFFLIGLELKRELLAGELNSPKKAIFPFIAALGGIVVPIGLYILLNDKDVTAHAWGIPMATDIAFALAVLMLLGSRVPLSLKVFLTAFAIIDDLAAVLVIALFYSHGIHWSLLLYAILLVLALGIYFHKVKYHFSIGIIVSIIVWLLFLKSGIHPTIAGVLLALTIPIKKRINIKDYTEKLDFVKAGIITNSGLSHKHLLSKEEMNCIDFLGDATQEVRSPLQYLENKLHGLAAYFILPVFAFANAGVKISSDIPVDFDLLWHIAVALFLGKLAGITGFTWAGIRLKLIDLPAQLNFKHIIGIGAIAGIGFTMSMFIANLAFAGDDLRINSAKIGIIIGSFVAGLTGYVILRLVKF